jgi:hypothetical protein
MERSSICHDDFDENQCYMKQGGAAIFNSSPDEDPFVTGKFCENTGKQFLFKYPGSGNNSKNATIRSNSTN